MFPPAASSYGPFSLPDGGKTTAYYLRQTAWTQFAQTDAWQAMELPHAGGVLRMLAILPAAPGGLAAVEAGLSSESFAQMVEQMKSEFVSVALPRFKIAGSYSLAAALGSLGIERAFQSGGADFSRLSKSAICLSGAIHKSVFEVAGRWFSAKHDRAGRCASQRRRRAGSADRRARSAILGCGARRRRAGRF